ncbi:MAG TPA: nitrate reductase associated protein [Terriglobales bacterium]|nr:nitrate reductase associated protein [Terriglobales bacterium]
MAENEDLCLMPRAVRDKLDRVGIKLHLVEWQALTVPEREELVELPCTDADELDRYRKRLAELVQRRTGGSLTRLSPA